MRSNDTSQTSSGRSSTHDMSFAPDHRLGPPGEITTAIQSCFFEAIQGKRQEYLEWLDFVDLDGVAAKEPVSAAEES